MHYKFTKKNKRRFIIDNFSLFKCLIVSTVWKLCRNVFVINYKLQFQVSKKKKKKRHTHPWPFSKSKFNQKSDRVNLVAPASPIECLLYFPNVRAIHWDRKGWPASEIQMYNSCPWKTTFIWLSCYHCNNARKILIYFSFLHFQNTFLELIPNLTFMQNLKNIAKKIKAFKIKCIKIKTKNHMSFR